MAENAIKTTRLLVVSREPAVLRPLWSIGESNSWHLETAGSGWEAMERVQSGSTPDLLLLDLPRGDADSLHMLRWLRRLRPEMPIILIAHQEDAGREKEALRLGAQDYLVRPVEDGQLEQVIQRHLFSTHRNAENDITSEDVEQLSAEAFFVGASPVMRKLRAQAELLAEANVPVMIVGEGGSGKETIARLIHKLSVRSGFPFGKVNCAALSAELLENELFGYEREASNGSPRTKPGKFELCDKGTILLDEISEMPADLQTKLVQILQTKQFARPGGLEMVDADVRIIAAVTASDERAGFERRLREDLYYRLSAFTVYVPPLRQRRDEIPLLLQQFMHHLAKHYNLQPRAFSAPVLKACQAHSWPGNLQELESFVKRYLVLGDKDLAPGEWSPDMETRDAASLDGGIDPRFRENEPSVTRSEIGSLKLLVQGVKFEAERSAIAAALDKTGWNRKAAAGLLKVSYRTLLYKIEHYHMHPSDAAPFAGGNGSKTNGNGIKGNGRVS
ncbi:MAG: sigma-54-dependent transcriptional regulator [Terriglobales bacterium]